jgi:hypothetical protein
VQRLKHYAILSLTIAVLVFPSTTSSRVPEYPSQCSPLRTSPSEHSQGPLTPVTKFVKSKKPIPNRYIVVLKDDVVSDDAPLEVRRARVTAIASSHAQTYGGKFDYVYETALKGYAIELPNEAAAIAISKLDQVRWVEEDAYGEPGSNDQSLPTKQEVAVCRGKSVPVSLMEHPFGLKMYGRRTSYLSGGISQRARLVIRGRDEFNDLWNQIMRPILNKPPLPEIDFSREMIIVAAMGQQPSRYGILIDSACEVDNQLEVLVRSIKLPTCGAEAGLPPEPVDIVRLPKTDLPVVFREIETASDCKDLLRP